MGLQSQQFIITLLLPVNLWIQNFLHLLMQLIQNFVLYKMNCIKNLEEMLNPLVEWGQEQQELLWE